MVEAVGERVTGLIDSVTITPGAVLVALDSTAHYCQHAHTRRGTCRMQEREEVEKEKGNAE